MLQRLVNTPLTNKIWWAVVDEKSNEIVGERFDVTDNAIESVLSHLTNEAGWDKKGFAGYDYDKVKGRHGKVRICAYDLNRYKIVDTSKYDIVEKKVEESDGTVEKPMEFKTANSTT